MVTSPNLEEVSGQDISNVLWAHAKLGVQLPLPEQKGLLQSLVRPHLLAPATFQALVNVLYAVSALQQLPGWQPAVKQEVWQRLLGPEQLAKIANNDRPQGVANALQALADMAAAGQPISAADAQACAAQLLQGSVVQQLSSWNVLDVIESASACSRLALCEQQFMERVVQRSQQLLQGEKGPNNRRQLGAAQQAKLAATVSFAVASLQLPELAGGVVQLIAGSGLKQQGSPLKSEDARMLWALHAWLVKGQLLDGRGLVGVLTEHQLADNQTAC